jgi:hypothetical protein
MYARVVKFEGGSADSIRESVEQIRRDAPSGPPEGVPAKGFTFLADPDGGRVLAISLFETEEDLRQGDAKLNEMSPPSDMGRRAAVETYEVAFEVRAS